MMACSEDQTIEMAKLDDLMVASLDNKAIYYHFNYEEGNFNYNDVGLGIEVQAIDDYFNDEDEASNSASNHFNSRAGRNGLDGNGIMIFLLLYN